MNSTSFYQISLYTATIIEQIKRLCITRVKFNVNFGCFKSRMKSRIVCTFFDTTWNSNVAWKLNES